MVHELLLLLALAGSYVGGWVLGELIFWMDVGD